MNFPRLLVLLLLCNLSARAATAHLLNIDFGNAAVLPAAEGAAAIGADDDVWNLSSQPFIPDNHLEGLKFADGSDSGAGVWVSNAPGAWTVPETPTMFRIYAYSYGGPITVTVTNLPAGKYDVYAYGHGERNELTTRFTLNTGGSILPAKETENSDRFSRQPWQEGAHYVVFRQASVSAGTPLVLIASAVNGSTPFLNGLQILRVGDADPPPVAGEPLLNVDFGNAAVQPAPTGAAAVGAAGDRWNLSSQPFIPDSGLTNLFWSDGSPSNIGLTVTNAPGAWTVPGTPLMFRIYAYSYGGPILVTLTNVPTATYDLFLYGHGEGDTSATDFEVISGDTSYGRLATSQGPGWRSTPYVEGDHYVVFRGVTVREDRPLRIRAHPAPGQTTPFLNGLQLIRARSWPLSFSVPATAFTNLLSVSILGGPADATIHYTDNGDEPTIASPVYSRALELRTATVLKARAFHGSEPAGDTIVAEYVRLYPESDGLTREWRRQHFGDGYFADPRSLAEADPDGDGASNLQEFVAGTDPVDALSGFSVGVRLVPSITWKSVPGQAYRVLRRERLDAGSWELFREVTADGDISRLVDADADRTWFYAIEPVR